PALLDRRSARSSAGGHGAARECPERSREPRGARGCPRSGRRPAVAVAAAATPGRGGGWLGVTVGPDTVVDPVRDTVAVPIGDDRLATRPGFGGDVFHDLHLLGEDAAALLDEAESGGQDRKSTRLNSSHVSTSYA